MAKLAYLGFGLCILFLDWVIMPRGIAGAVVTSIKELDYEFGATDEFLTEELIALSVVEVVGLLV